jgi:ribosomal protein S18 acetylase RimI-like enzyme
MTHKPIETEGKMRALDPIQDLNEVANLIELCFKGAMDDDGREYIQYLRKMARDAKNTYWGTGSFQRAYAPLQGFVYEENGRIIGNLSMLPYRKNGEFIYLIANVAVHPDYRRKGIARRLTAKALSHARIKSAASAWLQVRDDNPAAHELYIDMGFVERSRRSTWTLKYNNFRESLLHIGLNGRKRSGDEWEQHKHLLDKIYPQEIRWNLGLKEDRFQPGILASISRFFNGVWIRHWTVRNNKDIEGIGSLERTSLFSDNLWIAVNEEMEGIVIPMVVNHFFKTIQFNRPMTVNYPVDRAEDTFRKLGFEKNHTLIWMEEPTNRPLHFD